MKITPDDLGRINDSGEKPKFLQIADRVRELIEGGHLALGDRLPSVNQIISHFSVSRDTAVKAYQELKDRGIIESTPNKACFVSNVLLHDDLKHILFLSDSMTSYKEKIYYGLIDTLSPGYYVDVVTHSDNFDILKNVYEKYRSMRNCVAYLVVPTAAQNQEEEYFKYVNPGNLLFLDRRLAGLSHPAVWQDFRKGFCRALAAESSALAKYRRMVFLTKYFTNPIIEEMKESFAEFASGALLPFTHQHTMFTDKDIRGKIDPSPGDLFVILDEHLLAATLTACGEKGLALGKDVGIIAVNEGLLYEHLPVPVSVLSADFYGMGMAAARFVMDGSVPQDPVATRLIVRDSV